jgi:hypothetical protein
VIGGIFGDDVKMAGDKVGMTSVWVLLLCVVAVLSSCNRDSDSTPSVAPRPKPKTSIVAKRRPTVAEQTLGMVQAASQGKSQVPVELKFELGGRPKVGQSLEINLALISQVSATPASIQVSTTDALTLAPGANQFDIASAEAGEVYRETVNVTPNAEGVLLVGLTVSLKHDEVTEQRTFSIPIIAER